MTNQDLTFRRHINYLGSSNQLNLLTSLYFLFIQITIINNNYPILNNVQLLLLLELNQYYWNLSLLLIIYHIIITVKSSYYFNLYLDFQHGDCPARVHLARKKLYLEIRNKMYRFPLEIKYFVDAHPILL